MGAVITGRSAASRKGTSWSEVLRFIGPADPVWRDNRILAGLSSGEGLIHAVRDPVWSKEPVRNKDKEIIRYNDVIIDHGVEDKRLLALETEFGRSLKAMAREGNTLSAVIRQAYDGFTLGTITKSPHRATNTHVSIVGHITFGELKVLLQEVDAINGFANRFLWVAVRRSRFLPFGGAVPDAVVASLRERLRRTIEWAKDAEDVHWTDHARELWQDAYPDLTRERPGILGSILSRAEAHTLRLALIYALLDQSRELELPHFEAALAVWRFAERSAAYIFGDSLGDPNADRILAALRETPQGLTRTEIRRKVFNDHVTAAKVRQALSLLLSAGLVHERREETGGAPAHRYFATHTPQREKRDNPAPNGSATGAYHANHAYHADAPAQSGVPETADGDREVFEL
jgi:DNA-binding transcriptional ArsR family regulator